jgi:hypothetical protein
MTQCTNKRCTCLAILGDVSARASVMKYLTWFEQRNKYKQDSIVFKWYQGYVLNLWKRGTWNRDRVTWAQLIEHADKVLKPIQCVGLNLYKIVEMYKNYRLNVAIEYHSDLMYMEPSEEVWLKVKVEMTERSEFRANLKAKKYAGKEHIESMAFGDGEAKM